MANLSSDTLFHFTSGLDVLQQILKGGLRYGMFAEKFPISKTAYFIRGISFCNIPLSMISEHVEWYGKYAVGVKRSYLREMGASPVFYVHSKTKMFPKGEDAIKSLLENPFLCYIKQHYGKQFHKGQNVYKYKKFYDEKEWRMFAGKSVIERYATSSDLEKMRKEKDKTEPLVNSLVLAPSIIEYIILEKPQDFVFFNSFLHRHFSSDEREILLPKVLYCSQILNDF